MHAYLAAFLGGLFIGLAGILLWTVNGRVMGVSGILGMLLSRLKANDRQWRFAFIVGILAAAASLFHLFGKAAWFEADLQTPVVVLIIGGLCVGFGTRMSHGCTSGHGICGIS